jgi:hypothetical protein
MRLLKTISYWLCCLAVGALLGCSPALDILPTELPDGAEGQSYSQTLTADGQAPYNWRLTSGGLPPGLVLGGSSGVLSGTPVTAGAFDFAVTATDASFPPRTGDRAYMIVIIERLTLDATLQPARVNEPYSDTLTAAGGVPPYTFSLVGLPAGLSLDAANGTIAGTPLTSTQGLRLDAAVTDSGNPRQSAARTTFLVVKPPPVAITTTTLAAGRVNRGYSQQLEAADGFAPYKWAVVAGVLPDGLSLNLSTGVISGTPTRSQTASVSIRVTDSDSPPTTDTKAFAIDVLP